jgi:hypothetical protein
MLPASLPAGAVVIHEVLADEAVGYARRDEALAGDLGRAREVGLWLSLDGATVTVERLPNWAAYPRHRPSSRLFNLGPGQVGRYRANFWFTGCACNPSWYFEPWTVHIGNGQVRADRYAEGTPDHDVDDRVHLYGGLTPTTGAPVGHQDGGQATDRDAVGRAGAHDSLDVFAGYLEALGSPC